MDGTTRAALDRSGSIAVLGGTGFVGAHVMSALETAGYGNVRPVSRSTGVDLVDLTAAKRAFTGLRPAVVVNCSAHVGGLHYIGKNAAQIVDDNMRMILNMYKAVAEECPTARVINPIANCSYPGDASNLQERDWWSGPVHESVWAFGNTRRMIGVVSRCYASQFGVTSYDLLVPNAFGPGDHLDPHRTHALNGMIIRMLQAREAHADSFEVWGTGKPRREWLYVKDLARVIVAAMEAEELPESPMNVAQNRAFSIEETARTIRRLVGYTGRLVFNPAYPDGAPEKRMNDDLFRRHYPDFEFTPLADAILETIRDCEARLGLRAH